MHEVLHILSHAGNCHGEITIWVPMLMSAIEGLPFIGTWLSAMKPPAAHSHDGA
jgi:hypothetical protein